MCFFCTLESATHNLTIFNQKLNLGELNNKPATTTFEFNSLGSKWGESQVAGSSGGTVTYGFAMQNKLGQFGIFDSFITNEVFQSEISAIFAAWENAANVRFNLSSDPELADIRLGWRDIDGKGGVLGQTTIPSSGPLSSVVVALDVNEDWFIGGDAPQTLIDFSSTVTHEIGHALGIAHLPSSSALMNANYSTTIFEIQQDDIDAANAIYGTINDNKIDVYRFFNPNSGGHFFTADIDEKDNVINNTAFESEGTGFRALSSISDDPQETSPVYRFLNIKLGSHLFTSFEMEKNHLMTLNDFAYEGIGFRAFTTDSVTTTPIYRFFNTSKGGHFFTASEMEKEAVMLIPNFQYEGEAFYAFS